MMDYNQLELRIRQMSRRYVGGFNDIDDLTQIGLIACWLYLEKTPNAPISHLIVEAKSAILKELRRERAQKRMPENGFLSFQHSYEKDGTTLEEKTGREDKPFSEKRDSVREFIGTLREKIGYFYVFAIKGAPASYRIRRAILEHVIEDIEGLSPEEIPNVVDTKFFEERGLEQFLKIFYGNSPFRAMADLYGDRFFQWEFKKTANGFWHGRKGYENALAAIKWLAQKKGAKTPQEAARIKDKDFVEAGLEYMLKIHFNSSVRLALQTVYPNIKPWEFYYTPAGFFKDIKKQHKALLSFLLNNNCPAIDEFTPEETYEQGLRTFVRRKTLNQFGLSSLLQRHNGSIYTLFKSHFSKQILPWTLWGTHEPWRENPKETGDAAMRWLIENYLGLPINELPLYLSQELLTRVGFFGIASNKRIGYNGRTYLIADRLYPGKFTPWDFRRGRKGIIVPDHPNFKRSKREISNQDYKNKIK